MVDYKKLGKNNRAKGKAFELRVRHDLEKKGWIVDRWSNNVEFTDTELHGKIIPAKHTFNYFTKAMSAGNGFPDFVCFKKSGADYPNELRDWWVKLVECKINGYLKPEEKQKIEWIKTNLKIPVIVAKKGIKRGEIIYE